jgi:hypothetical protein
MTHLEEYQPVQIGILHVCATGDRAFATINPKLESFTYVEPRTEHSEQLFRPRTEHLKQLFRVIIYTNEAIIQIQMKWSNDMLC